MKSSKANCVPVFGFSRLQTVIFATAIAAAVITCSGCATRSVFNDSSRKAHTRAAAIQARDLGDGAAGIGVDVSALDVLAEQPIKQLGAAILDAGAIYGGYVGVKALADEINSGSGGSSSSAPSTSSVRSTPVSVTGDGNSVQIDMHVGGKRK